MGIIYKHTILGESYIGYTKFSMEDRLNQHLKSADNGINTHFYNKIRKYGIDAIESEILEECNDCDMAEREMFWINHLDTFRNGLNMTIGGDGGATRTGMSNSDEHKRKSSETQRGSHKCKGNKCGQYHRTDENKRNIALSVLGTRWMSNPERTKDIKVKPDEIEEFQEKGYTLGRCRFSIKNRTQRPHTEEQKQHLSKMNKGKIVIYNPELDKCKMVHLKEFEEKYKQQGFRRGRK